MKIRYILIIFILIGKANYSFSQKISENELKTDLNYFRDSLAIKHLNLFSKISKESFLKKCNILEKELTKLNKDEFIIELFKINASIAEEHTILLPKYNVKFPLKFELFDDAMVIVGADSAYQNLLSSKILEINGISYLQIQKKFTNSFKRDNPSYLKIWQNYFFNKPEFFKGLRIISSTTYTKFKVLTSSGKILIVNIPSIPIDAKINYVLAKQYSNILPYQSKKDYWYKMDKSKNILYFNYVNCRNDPNEAFTDFNKKLFAEIQQSKPNKLIIDLRFNSGGNNAILKPFIDSIKNCYLNKTNSFFVLIGSNTFSSSLMNAIDLKRFTNSILIGEESGGSINHYGELKSFELPNTRMQITYSTKYWENWKNHDGPLKPDYKVSHTYQNFLNNIDEALQYIYALGF